MRTLVSHSAALLATLLVAGCFGSSKDVSEYVARGRQYISEGNTGKAWVELQNALRIDPANAQINFMLARIEDAAGNLQAAVPYYVRASAPDANLLDAQLRIVEILLDSNRLQDASGRINAAVGSFPGSASALALRADLAERQGQLGSAKTDATNALEKDKNNPRALAVLAMLGLRNNDGTGALGIVNRGLGRDPNDLRLLQVQAAAQLTLNQPDKAVEALRSIIRSTPRNIAVQTTLAELEARNGKSDEAIANFKAAVDANPSSQELQLAFAKFLAGISKGGDASAYLISLIDRYPTTETYDLALAGLYRSQGNLEKSRQTLQRAEARLSTGQGRAAIQVALAKVSVDLGDQVSARAELEKVTARDPNNVDALLLRAQLNQQAGRTTAAIADLTSLVRNDPVNGQAFQALATAYLAQGEPARAVESMRRALSTDPGNENAQVTLAAFLENAGDQEGARDIMARVTLRRPNDPFVWIANAQIAIDRKDWGAVSRSLTRLRDLPGSASTASLIDAQMRGARGDDAGAVKMYQGVIASQTSFDPSLLSAYGRSALAARQSEAAAAFLQTRSPSLPDSLQSHARAVEMTLWSEVGRAEDAAQAFNKAVQLSPKAASLYSSYVGILLKDKNFAAAKQVVQAGLAAGASSATLLVLKGWVEENAGDKAAAMASYKAALAADPLSLDAANNYGSLVADQSPKDVDALNYARVTLNGAESVNNPSVIDTVAWLDYRLGRFEQAKALLSRINAKDSTDPQLRFHFAAVLLASGDRADGSALLETVKGLSFPGSQEAQALSAT